MVNYSSYKPDGVDDALVLEVTGRLDSSTSKPLMDCIASHIESGERKIVLDCSELIAISSEGLATFVGANSRLKKQGGSLSLAGVNGSVENVLKIVHFDKLFNIFPSVEEAAKALQ